MLPDINLELINPGCEFIATHFAMLKRYGSFNKLEGDSLIICRNELRLKYPKIRQSGGSSTPSCQQKHRRLVRALILVLQLACIGRCPSHVSNVSKVSDKADKLLKVINKSY